MEGGIGGVLSWSGRPSLQLYHTHWAESRPADCLLVFIIAASAELPVNYVVVVTAAWSFIQRERSLHFTFS